MKWRFETCAWRLGDVARTFDSNVGVVDDADLPPGLTLRSAVLLQALLEGAFADTIEIAVADDDNSFSISYELTIKGTRCGSAMRATPNLRHPTFPHTSLEERELELVAASMTLAEIQKAVADV